MRKGSNKPKPNPKPASLRDRLRLLQRDAVLDVACELFLARGYRATTTALIAEKAEIGVATVFRYFRSKEGVLAALSRRDLDKILSLARAAAAAPTDDPAKTLLEVCARVLEMHRMPSTQIRGQTRIWLLIPSGHRETDEVVISSDREFREIIHDLLKHYRRCGRIERRHDLSDMTMLIFAVFYHHYLSIALNRSTKIEQVVNELRRRIPLLISGWTTG